MNHKRVCDLCETRETEFTVTSKHLSYIDEDLKKYNEFNTNHIVKHICKDCFMKLKQFQKVNEGILNYIICRVTLGHKYDDSYRITPEATEEEQKLYNEALKFLRSLREESNN